MINESELLKKEKNTGVTLEFDEKTGKYRFYIRAPKIEYLVISGGGAKGVILPGVLKAFEDFYPEKDGPSFMQSLQCIAGSSIGAVTAGIIASGITADELIAAANIAGGKTLLGEGFLGLLDHDGIPLTKFIRENMWKSIENCLYRIYATQDKKSIITSLTNIVKAEEIRNIITYLETGEMKEITFATLEILHQMAPQYFKSLVITGTEKNLGKTIYFDYKTTPNLDIVLACRASAALPLVIQPAEIPVEQLKGGELEKMMLIPDKGSLAFVDGGYLDNIPVEFFENPEDPFNKLKILALVFDEAQEVLGQSPMLNVKNPSPVYNPGKSEGIIRDWVPTNLGNIKTIEKNTQKKSQKLEYIREEYTQRHIPLKMDISTTDFNAAAKNSKKYQEQGQQNTKEYLENHQDELICYYEASSLDELNKIIPHEFKHLSNLLAGEKKFDIVSIDNKSTLFSQDNLLIKDSSMDMLENLTKKIIHNYKLMIGSNDIYDPKDQLMRKYTDILNDDLNDNLNNNLNAQQKRFNIIKIILVHYYNPNLSGEYNQHKIALAKILFKINNINELKFETRKIRERIRNEHIILDKMYPEKQLTSTQKDQLFNKFNNSISDIVFNNPYWEGKAVSKIGRTTKIPDTIIDIGKIINNKKFSPEEKYYRIQEMIEISQQNISSTRSKEAIAFYQAVSNCRNLFEFYNKKNYLDDYKNEYINKVKPDDKLKL